MKWSCLAMLTSALACAGCHRAPPPTTSPVADAGPDATVAPVPYSAQVVARSVGVDMELVRMKDDGLVVVSGPALWTVMPNGALQRIGTPADSVPLLVEGDDEMGGYDARMIHLGPEAVSGAATTPFVRPTEATTFQWTGNAWTKAGSPPPPERLPAYLAQFDRGEVSLLPTGYEWKARSATKNAVAWLGHKRPDDYRLGLVDDVVLGPSGDRPAHVVELPSTPGKKMTYRSCDFIDSADDRIYVACVTSRDDDFQKAQYVLDGDHWTPLAINVPDSVRAIAADGAIWYVAGGHPPPSWVVRLTPDGKEERFDPPAAPAELAAPGYRSEDIPIEVGGTGASEIRHWIATEILDPVPPKPMGWIYELVPRRSGEVWAIGRDSGSVQQGVTIVRYARGARGTSGPPPTLIRSAADEHNAVQEARGIRTWGGRCNSVFVPFPHAQRLADAGAEPTKAFYTEHKAAIDDAVAITDRKGGKPGSTNAPLEVAIVDGRLGGRPVGGILFIRSDPDADEKRLATAIQKLTEVATPDPASPPTVTCTMPELDRVIERLRVAKPQRY